MHFRHGPHDHDHAPSGIGHNHTGPKPVQWQSMHTHGESHDDADQVEADIDLVERSFVEGFSATSDPTSFLRLAGIPLSAEDGEGRSLNLLRVEIDQKTDVGALSPHVGGQSFRYDPLPEKLVSKRQDLRFVYHNGEAMQVLSFSEAKALTS